MGAGPSVPFQIAPNGSDHGSRLAVGADPAARGNGRAGMKKPPGDLVLLIKLRQGLVLSPRPRGIFNGREPPPRVTFFANSINRHRTIFVDRASDTDKTTTVYL